MAPRMQQPTAIEREYVKELRRYARRLQVACNEILIPEIDRLVEMANRYRPDALDPRTWIEELEDLLAQVLSVVTGVRPEGLAAVIGVRRHANDISDHNRRQVQRMVKAKYGDDYAKAEPWLEQMLRTWEVENLRLIRSIPPQYADKLQGTIVRSINEQQSVTDIVNTIKSTYSQPVNRAELIARDQVGKLHSQLAQARQKAIGVKSYLWRGILDARERPEHRVREGREYDWDNPPWDGHPGTPINCRCYGQPVWPDRDEVELS